MKKKGEEEDESGEKDGGGEKVTYYPAEGIYYSWCHCVVAVVAYGGLVYTFLDGKKVKGPSPSWMTASLLSHVCVCVKKILALTIERRIYRFLTRAVVSR